MLITMYSRLHVLGQVFMVLLTVNASSPQGKCEGM